MAVSLFCFQDQRQSVCLTALPRRSTHEEKSRAQRREKAGCSRVFFVRRRFLTQRPVSECQLVYEGIRCLALNVDTERFWCCVRDFVDSQGIQAHDTADTVKMNFFIGTFIYTRLSYLCLVIFFYIGIWKILCQPCHEPRLLDGVEKRWHNPLCQDFWKSASFFADSFAAHGLRVWHSNPCQIMSGFGCMGMPAML